MPPPIIHLVLVLFPALDDIYVFCTLKAYLPVAVTTILASTLLNLWLLRLLLMLLLLIVLVFMAFLHERIRASELVVRERLVKSFRE